MPYTPDAGFAYTIATGRLYCSVAVFHEGAEELLGRSVWTHEFADQRTWEELRAAFEERALEVVNAEIAAR